MKIVFSTLILILLAGCSASAKYDIDVECWKNGEHGISFQEISMMDADGIQSFSCMAPKIFVIKCSERSVQRIDETYLCSTEDEKSVRVRLVTPSN